MYLICARNYYKPFSKLIHEESIFLIESPRLPPFGCCPKAQRFACCTGILPCNGSAVMPPRPMPTTTPSNGSLLFNAPINNSLIRKFPCSPPWDTEACRAGFYLSASRIVEPCPAGMLYYIYIYIKFSVCLSVCSLCTLKPVGGSGSTFACRVLTT